MPKIIQNDEIFVIKYGRKRRAKEYICPNCKSKFIRAIAHTKTEKPFCSKKCFIESRKKEKPTLICDYCGKEFKRKKSKMKSKSGKYFCCRKCLDEARKIKNNIVPVKHYQNGVSTYREQAINNYGAVCSHCDYNEFTEGLDVHHIDGNRENNDLDNLMVLCTLCHVLVERGIYKVVNRKLKRI